MTRRIRSAGPGPRVRFLPKDLLTASDLQADAAAEARLRGLHVRALHDTWGIALGFHADTSDAGDWILVGSGFAFDACQREMVLNHPVLLPPPAPPALDPGPEWWFDLVAREAQGGVSWRWLFAGARTNAGQEPPPLAEEAWLGIDLPIARVVLDATHHVGRVDSTWRRCTRPARSARMASGRVEAGEGLNTQAPNARQWSKTIDITGARFSKPPLVLVSLEAHPLALDPAHFAQVRHVLGPYLQLAPVTSTHVTVTVRFALRSGVAWSWPSVPLDKLPVALRWIAVERPARAEPPVDLTAARTLEGREVPGLAGKFSHLLLFPPQGGVIT